MNIGKIFQKYHDQLDHLDLELLIASIIKKTREFVLTHPEFAIAKNYESRIMNYANRRIKNEPLAYILGEKEFYGLKFKVNKNTLIPRPETEMIVDLVLNSIEQKTKSKKDKLTIADVGTGSGNIIISIAKKLLNHESGIMNYDFFGTDISAKALAIAKYNAKINKVDNKIKFLKGNLLDPIVHNSIPSTRDKIQNSTMIITANLPYLSSKIYSSCSQDIKKYEPKSALISRKEGLAHCENLLRQIFKYQVSSIKYQVFLEISPEQKSKISKLIKQYFPKSKITLHKDLSGRWRVCETEFRI